MNKIFLMMMAILLTACNSTTEEFRPKTQVQVVTSTSYPELPDISLPPKPRLQAWKWDFPRNGEVYIRNTSDCTTVAKEFRNVDFWNRCGVTPVDKDSNVFIGVDQKNYNIILRNFEVLKEDNLALRERIRIANAQRARWRNLAESERQRVQNQLEELKRDPEKTILTR